MPRICEDLRRSFRLGEAHFADTKSTLKTLGHWPLPWARLLLAGSRENHAEAPWRRLSYLPTPAPWIPRHPALVTRAFALAAGRPFLVVKTDSREPAPRKGHLNRILVFISFRSPLPGTTGWFAYHRFGVCYFFVGLLRDVILYGMGMWNNIIDYNAHSEPALN